VASAQSGVISTMKYPLDHGIDLMKADVKGHVVLHNAICAGMSHQGFWSCLCGCVPVCLYFYVHHMWFCKMVQKLGYFYFGFFLFL